MKLITLHNNGEHLAFDPAKIIRVGTRVERKQSNLLRSKKRPDGIVEIGWKVIVGLGTDEIAITCGNREQMEAHYALILKTWTASNEQNKPSET